MSVLRVCAASLVLVVAAIAIPAAEAEANQGEALFKKNCQACHTLTLDEPRRQGPPLGAIFGKTAGKIDGFPYSAGLKKADWTWTEEKLDAWLTRPKDVVADTYMIYRQDDS